MSDPAVTSEMRGDVVVTRLCRPPHNFIDTAMLSALVDALIDAEKGGARAGVISAEGRSFCAGANFGSGGFTAGDSSPGDNFKANVGEFYRHAVRLFEVGLPIVAAVMGPAVGAGVGLAVACDFRVVGTNAFYATNFVRLGIHPGFGLSLTLPELIGPARAADMMLTGRRVGGDEALAMGLADRLTESEKVIDLAIDLAGEIASAAPLAVAATRQSLRAGLAGRVSDVLDHELAEQARLVDTADSREGIAALLEKRPPRFTAS